MNKKEENIIKAIAKEVGQDNIDKLVAYLRKDLDNKPRRRRAKTQFTYEYLGLKLDVDGNKILFIEADNDCGILYIHHTDEDIMCFDIAEGQCAPCVSRTKQPNPELDREMKEAGYNNDN